MRDSRGLGRLEEEGLTNSYVLEKICSYVFEDISPKNAYLQNPPRRTVIFGLPSIVTCEESKMGRRPIEISRACQRVREGIG